MINKEKGECMSHACVIGVVTMRYRLAAENDI